jgi:predicted N-acyltransferase
MDGRTGPGLREPLALHDRADVVHRLFATAERIAAREGEQSVVCRSVDTADHLLRSVLKSRSYIEFPGHQHLILRTPEGGLEGYIASFRKNRRSMIRRELRKLHDADVRIAIEPLTKELAGSVLPLIANLNRRYGVAIDVDAIRAELGMLRKFFKQDVHAVVARHQGQPVGYMDFIVYQNNAWAGQVGFDYEFQGTLPIYFGVLFYGIVDFASSANIASIDYSFESEEAKTSRGCVSRPTVRLIRALDPANQSRLGTLAASMNANSMHLPHLRPPTEPPTQRGANLPTRTPVADPA